ncbi:hypothetical protein GCM10027290_48860 [Micromonospora sonneratiae]|uniref:Peptidoglycan binding-like domain-containing protein n=1 Tax=Micromonospora sonneratiae TaxID=1184706 RepID=A0ABW3YP87_9ACTN
MEATAERPFVVCGPIVRRVDPDSATVFIAVRSACTVTLTVFETDGGSGFARGATVATGSREAVRLGEHLYVVAVRAAGQALTQGTLYGYDMSFTGPAVSWASLMTPQVVAASESAAIDALSYVNDPRAIGGAPDYPSFVTPPANPSDLRIFHGSCRKPHGEGIDAFPLLDPVIAAAGGDPKLRPHQLVLGGDQIYADDVADVLLAMMNGHDAVPAREGIPAIPALPGIADSLGMPPEALPVGTTNQPTDRQYQPGKRGEALSRDAKFTSGKADSHLMSLREYVCMYLMTWSDQLWPERYPKFEEVFPADTHVIAPIYDLMRAGKRYTTTRAQEEVVERYERWYRQTYLIKAFQLGLPAVRRQLANVATYMIADDHEISDDWNMTRSWVIDASVTSELGRRIVRNGMSAYAIFQAWGNNPEQFAEEGTAGQPGREALSAIEGWQRTPNSTDDGILRERLGLPTGIDAKGRMVRPAGALKYHYTVTWPRYQLVALDTRTWREFPAPAETPDGKPYPGGLLLSDDPLNEMVSGGGVLEDEAVTVVAQPIALFGMPLLEQVAQPVMNALFGRYEADGDDAWVSSDAAVHKLIARLLAAAPPGPDGIRRRRLVMLGGDIHFGSAERIRYSATLPYACGPDPNAPFEGVNRTEGVIAGFVSSALRNEDDKTRMLNDFGYVPAVDVLGQIDLVGWANEKNDGKPFQAGVQVAYAADAVAGWRVTGRPAVGENDRLKLLTRPPEWALNVRFIHHDEADPEVDRDGQPETVVDPTGMPREEALAQYLAATRNLDGYLGKWGNGKEIVGYNNLGEITFDWRSGERKSATQRLWWRLPGAARGAALTKYTVDLSYGCSLLVTPPYGGYVLRTGDYDARSTKTCYDGVERPLVTDNWIAKLQADLATLRFLPPGVTTGEFDRRTYWAVREFQTYARGERVAHEPADRTDARYSDRLQPVDVPEADRYLGPVSGVADLATQVAIKHWLTQRWRCPVVVESWQVAGGSPQRLAAGNVWLADEVVAADQRLYSRVVTGRPADAGPAPTSHPELIPLGRYETWPTSAQWAGPVVEPVSELMPEALIPPAPNETEGPSLDRLATELRSGDDGTVERARRQLSTFKVLRAVAEQSQPASAGAYFDALVAADSAILRIGPFGWRGHGPQTAPVSLPSQTNTGPGQWWAYLAYLRAFDRDAYDVMGGLAGVSAVPGWGKNGSGLLVRDLQIARANPAYSDTTGGWPVAVGTFAELRELRGWHFIHRFTLGLRSHPGVRRGMWTFARQGLHDLLTTSWDSPDPTRTPTVPDVPGTDGNLRRARIGELFTSELAVARLACWQMYRAHQLVSPAPPNAAEPADTRGVPRAATELHEVLRIARTYGPDFSGAPGTWTDDHESALIAAIGQVTVTDPEVAAAMVALPSWPSWPTGRTYTLPVEVLPEEEQLLSSQRGSMRLDTTDLPRFTA